MNSKKEVRAVIVDLDGVILKNSIVISLNFLYDYLAKKNQFVAYDTLQNFYKSINSFPLSLSLTLLFDSIGLSHLKTEFAIKLMKLKKFAGERILVDEGFFRLRQFCENNRIVLKIFSLSSVEKIKRFVPDVRECELLILPGASKAKASTFHLISSDLRIVPGDIVIVDDDPFVLRSADVAGLNTVMMMNSVFTEKDYRLYSSMVHFRVKSLDGLVNLIKREFRLPA